MKKLIIALAMVIGIAGLVMAQHNGPYPNSGGSGGGGGGGNTYIITNQVTGVMAGYGGGFTNQWINSELLFQGTTNVYPIYGPQFSVSTLAFNSAPVQAGTYTNFQFNLVQQAGLGGTTNITFTVFTNGVSAGIAMTVTTNEPLTNFTTYLTVGNGATVAFFVTNNSTAGAAIGPIAVYWSIGMQVPTSVVSVSNTTTIVATASNLVVNGVAVPGSGFAMSASNIKGVLYNASSWANLNDFEVVTDGAFLNPITVSNNGKITFWPANSFGDYLLITNMLNGGTNDDENYSIKINYTLLGNVSSFGIFAGTYSVSQDPADIIIRGGIQNNGTFYISQAGQGSYYSTQDPAFAGVNGNNITMTFQQLRDKFSVIGDEVSSNYETSYSITATNQGSPFLTPPNTSLFVIYNVANAPIQINSITVTSYSVTNAPWAIVGDSVVTGLQAEYEEYRFASILENWYGQPFDAFGGQGDTTVDINHDLGYILAFHPQNVLLRVGRNDIVDSTWNPNSYSNIVKTLNNAGINVWNMCAEPDNSGSYFVLNNFLQSQYPNNIVPVTNSWNIATMQSIDNTHPNPYGYQQLALDVAAAIPQLGPHFSHAYYHPFDNFQLNNGFGLTNLQYTNLVISGIPTISITSTNPALYSDVHIVAPSRNNSMQLYIATVAAQTLTTGSNICVINFSQAFPYTPHASISPDGTSYSLYGDLLANTRTPWVTTTPTGVTVTMSGTAFQAGFTNVFDILVQ